MNAPLHAYENLEVQTFCPPSRGLTFLRCFRLVRDGVTVGEASSTWAFMDAKTKSLIKVSDFHGNFPTGDPVDEASLPKPVRLPASLPMDMVGQRQIRYSDVDFNRHMNNTRYPDMVCDFLPPEAIEGRWLRHMSLAYLREAALGDVLSISRLPVPDKEGAWWLRATGADGSCSGSCGGSGSVRFEAEMAFSG
jgi:acyl-ACP thioesterase